MRTATFKCFPTADTVMPITRTMFHKPSSSSQWGSPSTIFAMRYMSNGTGGAASEALDANRVLSRQRSTASAHTLTNTNFLRSAGGVSSCSGESYITPLFSRRGCSTTPDAATSTEQLFYVHRTDLHGTTVRLSEVFLGREAAEAFASELESRLTKNHYSVEEVAVERKIVKSGKKSVPPRQADPKPADPSSPAVTTGGYTPTLSRISLHEDLGVPLRSTDKGGDEEGDRLKAQHERTLYEVWRMDTHGNTARCEPVHEEQAKADAIVEELRSHGHKQHYFVEVVKVTDSKAQKQQDEDDGWD